MSGSVVQLTDATGAVIKNYDYDAFGNHIVQSYDDANPFRYSGEYFDDETDLYYLRARYYWPSLGQFTQEDTYRGEPNNPNSLNLYTYCYNDPVQYVDRSGNSPETVLDVASLTYSAKAYREDPSFGNAISYYWDLGAVFIPIFPGTYIFKLGKWLKRSNDFVDVSETAKITKGVLVGKLDKLTIAEKTMVDDLLNAGKNVEIIPRSNIQSTKTPDFLVDGVKTELKTLNGTSLNTPVTRIQDGFKQGAEVVIIDGRNTGLTLEQANATIERALGKYGGQLPGTVEIWTTEGIVRR